MTDANLAWTCFVIAVVALAAVSLLLAGSRLYNRDLESDLEAAESRADANFAASGQSDDHYARCRQLTAENAGLRCELTEVHDQLEETLAEVKSLRLELWEERKRIRDAKKALDAPTTALVGTTDRAG